MPEMKDSGIEWIGEIPEDWKILRIKQLFSEVNDRCDNSENYTLLSVSEYYGVAPKSEKISDDDMLTHAESLDGYKICKENDLVMNIMLAWKRALGVSEYTGIVSPAYCIYRGKQKMCAKYFHYLFRTDIYANLFKQYSTGIIDSRLRLYSDKFLALKCQVPPIDTQRRIADYLDRKCSQIDAIIARQQEVIEKLKAYKLSVITEAVTRGLDPNVPMKDSGGEWIEEIPEKWQKAKLKNTCQFINGDRSSNYPSSNDYVDKGIPFLGADSLCGRYVDITLSKKITNEKYRSMGGAKIQKGDILYTLRGSTIGKNAMAMFDDGTVASSLMVIRPISLLPEFLLYWLNSEEEFQQRQSYINGSTAPNLSAENVGTFILFLPSTVEQLRIANFLDKKCNEIELAIQKKQRMIEKLSDYKKSLIYEVVTGKKEV